MQYSGLEYEEYIPRRHNWTEPILKKKLTHIAEVICDLDADVIGLQEVENDHILERLQKTLERVGCRYRYRAITDTKRTPIHTAVLSKIALKKRRDVVIFRRGKQRSILEVDLKTDPKLTLFVNHWKSKSGPESKRMPYAKAMMRRIKHLTSTAAYVMIGDFNSNYNEYQTIDPRHNDAGGRTGINHVLKTIRGKELVRLHTLERGYHYNLWLELPTYARWSHNFFGDKEGIDAIMIPQSLHDGKGWEYQEGSFGVFKSKYLFGKRGRVKRWEYKHGRHTGKGYSDHLPIYATFGLGEGSGSGKEGGLWEKVLSLFYFSTASVSREKPVHMAMPKSEIQVSTIANLALSEKITTSVRLQDIKVIWKSRDSAIIKQSKEGRAILLYRCAGALETGRRYDIVVYQKKRYKGLDELTDIAIEHTHGNEDISSYLTPFTDRVMQQKRYLNEIVSNITGIYRKGKIVIEGSVYPLYFKKEIKRPKEGQKIRIKRAQIGYYKNHNELVVWNQDDYQLGE